ncbi:MAG: hypothetical protein AVDCRST_MAG70-2007 [uncultured Thermomicrobiales bacterium]|uniref:MobA-like NTP transferase domain-containing protein n=1 Tax=uncultured Thermomicrobiales bacterium TaxID=1645740 RepID=A0A6J4V2P7_9BACT|nr:MAG: hypothetical protein AVDCRST_MAG70-2007 [uncultured Thermomicrobiales bacterium]
MGAPKLLLPLGGEPLLRHVVRAAERSRLDEVLVVVGYEADRVTAAIEDLGCRVVLNPDFRHGQASSLRRGVSAVSHQSGAVMILLGDQPEVSTVVIDEVIGAYTGSGASIVRPSYRGVLGHPVLFGRDHFLALIATAGDSGARDLLRRHAGSVVRVDIDAEPPPDVDTPGAFAALVARWPVP